MLTPSTVSVNAQGDACSVKTAVFTASEAGFGGTFTAVSNNTAIATVAPGPFSDAGAEGRFTVTSVTTVNGGPGTTITVSDGLGHTATETVTIPTCLP